MKEIDIKTIFIGIFVISFIFFKISERTEKHHYLKMKKYKHWEGKDRRNQEVIGRFVPFDKEYILDTKKGKIFKPEIN